MVGSADGPAEDEDPGATVLGPPPDADQLDDLVAEARDNAPVDEPTVLAGSDAAAELRRLAEAAETNPSAPSNKDTVIGRPVDPEELRRITEGAREADDEPPTMSPDEHKAAIRRMTEEARERSGRSSSTDAAGDLAELDLEVSEGGPASTLDDPPTETPTSDDHDVAPDPALTSDDPPLPPSDVEGPPSDHATAAPGPFPTVVAPAPALGLPNSARHEPPPSFDLVAYRQGAVAPLARSAPLALILGAGLGAALLAGLAAFLVVSLLVG